MKVTRLNIEATNKFATNYLNESEEVMQFFDYTYKNENSFHKRVEDLKTRTFDRKNLVLHIREFMSKWSTAATETSLQLLEQDNSVVVIGGQQAGLLTGPLYSIHKVLSVLQLAKQQEILLGVPVIPVFWIAGEDHDYQEVNHIYVHNENEVKRFADPVKIKTKPMVSEIAIDKEAYGKLVDDVVRFLGETEHSKIVISKLKELINSSENYVDFFAALTMELFKDSPLLLVDSGNKAFKQLQKNYLIQQINATQEITAAVLEQQNEIAESGFANTIERSDNAANLFYYDAQRKERVLLDYVNGKFINEQKQISFTKEEMIALAASKPEVISNNVVTRPVMQEFIFPTLAFIGGPGEISYWAELKQVFAILGLKMPIIVPRVNISVIDQHCRTKMNELNVSIEDALSNEVKTKKDNHLAQLRDMTVPKIINETEELLEKQYNEMLVNITDVSLKPIMEKNLHLIINQLNFLDKKVERSFLLKEETLIKKYDYISNHLYPQGTYQERKINVIQFLNVFGLDFVKNLAEVSLKFDGSHHVIEV